MRPENDFFEDTLRIAIEKARAQLLAELNEKIEKRKLELESYYCKSPVGRAKIRRAAIAECEKLIEIINEMSRK